MALTCCKCCALATLPHAIGIFCHLACLDAACTLHELHARTTRILHFLPLSCLFVRGASLGEPLCQNCLSLVDPLSLEQRFDMPKK